MKLARCAVGNEVFWGIVDNDRVTVAPIVGDIVEWGPPLTRDGDAPPRASASHHRLADVRLLPPMSSMANVVGIGGNYTKHVDRLGLARPDQPGCFMKTARSVIGPADDIRYPAITDALDFEAELVVVLGAEPRPGEDPMRSIIGYTIGNEISARDLQFGRKDGRSDLFSGKALDRTAPVGPWIVTRDEFDEAEPDFVVRLTVGGETRQTFRTSEMTWGIASLIEYVHARSALAAGDLMFTGTSTGVGKEDGRYLQPGDVVEVAIEGLGSLRNRVAPKEPARL